MTETRNQVALQCKAVAHLATVLAKSSGSNEHMLLLMDDISDAIGLQTARQMELLGNMLNDMDAVDKASLSWLEPIFEEAQRRWLPDDDEATAVTPLPAAASAVRVRNDPFVEANLESVATRNQVALQCKAVAHLATVLAKSSGRNGHMLLLNNDLSDAIGLQTARQMEVLGDMLNDMDAVDKGSLSWLEPIFEEAQRRWPPHDDEEIEQAVTPVPDGYEMFEGRPMKIINGDRTGWWRFHEMPDETTPTTPKVSDAEREAAIDRVKGLLGANGGPLQIINAALEAAAAVREKALLDDGPFTFNDPVAVALDAKLDAAMAIVRKVAEVGWVFAEDVRQAQALVAGDSGTPDVRTCAENARVDAARRGGIT